MTSWRTPADHAAVAEEGTEHNRPKISAVSVGPPLPAYATARQVALRYTGALAGKAPHRHESPPVRVPAEPLGFGDVVGLGRDDDVVYGILRLGRSVEVAAEGGADIFGREEGARVRVGMVDHLDRARAVKAGEEEAQVGTAQIVAVACRAGKPFRIESVVAVLLVHTGPDLVDH